LLCGVVISGGLGFSILGIQTVQRSARDSERKTVIELANLEIVSAYGLFGSYPNPISINNSGNIMNVGTKTIILEGASQSISIEDNSTGTRYCYSTNGKSYVVGVELETGSWYKMGDTKLECKQL